MSKRNKLPPIKSGSKQKLSTSDSNKYLVSANSMEMVERNSKKHNDANLTPTAQGRHWAHHFHDDTLPDEDELKRCNSLFDNDEVEFVNDITPWKAYYTTQGFVAYYNENTQENTWEEPAIGYTWYDKSEAEEVNLKFEQEGKILDPEGLTGDDWNAEGKKWREPQIALAEQFANANRYKNGKGTCFDIDIESLGEGMVLYFAFLKIMIGLFTVMTILVSPLLLANFSGSRIPNELVGNGLSKFSIINAGHKSSSSCFLSFGRENGISNMKSCLDSLNATKIPMLNLSLSQYTNLVVYIDVIYTMLMIVGVQIVFNAIYHKLARDADFHTCSITDYAVVVSGLPKNDSVEKNEVIDHFSSKFDLHSEQNWRGKTRSNEQKRIGSKVECYNNTNDKRYLGKFVAEVEFAYDDGKLIRALQHQRDLFARIRRQRAQFLMYRSGEFLNKNLADRAFADYLATKEQADNILKRGDIKAMLTRHDSQKRLEKAFVVFNNEESYLECLADYHLTKSGYCIGKCCQEDELKFRYKHPLQVERAPDPSEIIYENVHVTGKEHCWRKCVTWGVTFVWLLICFGIITGLYRASNLLITPNCPRVKAGHFFNLVNNSASSRQSTWGMIDTLDRTNMLTWNWETVRLTRPTESKDQASKDKVCGEDRAYMTLEINSKHYNRDKFSSIVRNISYNASSCSNRKYTCKAENSASVGACPCVGQDTRGCTSHQCFQSKKIKVSENCSETFEYTGSQVVECYCTDLISNLISNGEYAEVQKMVYGGTSSSHKSDAALCAQSFLVYSLRFALPFMASFSITAFNHFIEVGMGSLIKFERHYTLSKSNKSQISKTFVGLWLNSGIILMLIKVNVPMFGISILQNPDSKYADGYDPLWYTSIGATLTMTMISDIIAPHAAPLLGAFVGAPLLKCRARRGAKRRIFCSKMYVTQNDLNNVFEPPEFELPVRMANMMATIAMTLMFAGPLPVLVPLAMVSFIISFWVDRYLIVNFYRKPPTYTSDIMDPLFQYFSYMIIFHMLMSLLAYSAPGVLYPLQFEGVKSIYGVTELDGIGSEQLSYDRPYVDGSNLPLFVLLLVYTIFHIVYIVLNNVVGMLLHRIKLLLLSCCCCCRMTAQSIAHKEYNPPYTSTFRKVLRDYSGKKITKKKLVQASISKSERKEGWDVRHDANRNDFYKCKQWLETGTFRELKHEKFKDLKKTYEVIDDAGLYSYNIDFNPRYRSFVQVKEASKDISSAIAHKKPKDPHKNHKLPDGWERGFDAKGHVYYYNTATNQQQWEWPGK